VVGEAEADLDAERGHDEETYDLVGAVEFLGL
jgi:hypothetical protein